MSHDDGDIVQLLIDTGLVTSEDTEHIQSKQVEVVLDLMLSKRALLPSETEEARTLLQDVMGTNRTRQLKAKMSLVNLITGNLHRRMGRAGDRVAAQKRRVTSGHFPAIAARIKTTKG